MKKIILITFTSMMLFASNSCKKILEVKPQDFVTPESYFNKEEDAIAALNAAWDMLTRQWMYSGYWQYRMLAADDVWCVLTGAYPANFKIDASESAAIPLMWNNLYTTIQYCNVLLDRLPNAKMDGTKKGYIRGEGLFLRAYCYFLLTDQWGAVPLRLTPTAGPDDVNIAATPVSDIYTLILKDMTEAESLVPTTANSLYG
ncbi:MAG: RagB/SusD family nutrient uptake outer membrane protein, partial [Bacteroidota bacterium]|nr:RagB/SusD family nutrient uptake outer membrane protein [Bacteroidota bacterium]